MFTRRECGWTRRWTLAPDRLHLHLTFLRALTGLQSAYPRAIVSLWL